MSSDIATVRRQLQQLQELHAGGAIDTAHYESSRQRLERQLVDLVMAGAEPASASATASASASAASSAAPAAPKPSRQLVLASTAFAVILAGAGYAWLGSPALLSQPASTSSAATPATGAADQGGNNNGDSNDSSGPAGQRHALDNQQIAAMVDKLRQRLEKEPGNAPGLGMLARSYAVLGRGDEAIAAYQKALALTPQDAALLADYADALAVRNNRSLAGEPMKAVEQALKLDPEQPKALSLAGTEAFDRKDYAAAVGYWERVLRTLPPDAAMAQQVRAGIAEARQLGGLPPAAEAAGARQTTPASPPANSSAAAAAGDAQVSGTIKLAPALAQQAAPDDTVFVFARASEGPRMPLAILRKQVKDLPFAFKLDDTTAMSPQMKLSGFARVIVGARISKSGNAMPQPGDLQGLSAPVAVGSKGLDIVISEKVGQ